MPPPHDGNEYLPFTELIKLKKIDENTYESVSLPFSPGGRKRPANRPKRSYGGHVYAQAAWAACQTVGQQFTLFNAVGSFMLPGQIDIPFTYTVQKISNGRSFCTRIVHVTQGEDKNVRFTGLISFKVPETSWLNVQEPIDLWEQYETVLQGKKPHDFPESPGLDSPWYQRMREETGYNDDFPGLECTQPDMTAYNQDKHPLDRRTIIFYRTLGEMPADGNLHRCAHLYASDKNSLFHVANTMDIGDRFSQMSSLVHTTYFHSSTDHLMFGPSKSNDSSLEDTVGGRWFALEDWSTRSSCGRTMWHARLSAPDGTHIATIIQDGLLRYTQKPEATKAELDALRKAQAGWKRREKL